MGKLTAGKILEALIMIAATLAVVCFAVWLFSVQFSFEWSFTLCLCVWFALAALKYVFGSKNG